MIKIPLKGRTFGRLVVLEDAASRTTAAGHKQTMSICRCDCGRTVIIANVQLREGVTSSCGCLRFEVAKTASLKHGHTKGYAVSKTYQSWACMITRCNNSNASGFKYYGARGIKADPRWVTFSEFLKDMGERPDGKTLGRIDNNGNYEPGNCRWETIEQQCRNRISNRTVTAFGMTACVKEICHRFGIPYKRTLARLDSGWSVYDAFHVSQFGRPNA